MGITGTEKAAIPHVESIFRDELARGDKALGSVAPVLTHLLASPGFSLVNEAIVARLRGMLGDIARQVLIAAHGHDAVITARASDTDRFADFLAQDSAILSHLYATAMEGHFTERLEARQSIDPVLGPLMQELVGSDSPETAELAMSAMAAQSRFVQSQRRMEHAVTELPAELFDLVLRRLVTYTREIGDGAVPLAAKTLKRGYDESTTRVGLMGRLIAGMGNGARAALDVEHAGMALFASALAQLTRQARELSVLACHERQGARLALSLRAAGLEEAEIEQQFGLLEPSETLPSGLGEVACDRAQAILGHSSARGMG